MVKNNHHTTFPDRLETVVGVGDFRDCGGGVFRFVGGPDVG